VSNQDLFRYNVELVRVVDGDTVVLNIDHGCNIWQRKKHCRLLGINAPERNTPEGRQAKSFLEILLDSDDLTIKTMKDHSGKYGRLLVTLYKGGRNINQHLVNAGHAEVMK
jgi:micrococcal nuclease